jgi:Asp-tRNA(Asn)/Glu-tRNA(Gln) amidotransferase C subunit
VTCSRARPAGILPAVTDEPIDLETLRRGARLAGFAWSDAELEEIRPQVEAALRLLRTLDRVDVGSIEPTTHYRSV